MNFKKLLIVMLVLAICFSLTLAAVACGDDNNTDATDDTTEKTEETADDTSESLLIANGTFEQFTSSNSAPYAPTSWSGSASDSSVESEAGVISLKASDYDAAKSNWGNLANPGNVPEAAEDNHVLMLYNNGQNVYTYSPSSNLSTSIGAYYKLTVQFQVKRGDVGITEGSGAYITFSGDVFHRFGPFNETDSWQTVTLYVEASQVSAKSIRTALSLGLNDNPSSGYAFFDNVLAEKITATQYAEADLSDATHTAAYSMLTPDGDFINSTETNDVKTPYTWTGKKGTGNGDTSSDTYVRSGLVNTANAESWSAWVEKAGLTDNGNVQSPYDTQAVKEGLSDDGMVLAISNEYALSPSGASLYEDCYTAYGFTNGMKMNIAPGTVYRLSVWVYTDLNDKDAILGTMTAREATDLASEIAHDDFGANIIFEGQGDYAFTNINTNKAWTEYVFYIFGSNTRYKSVNLELWLGKGGKSDATRASGTVYFDNMRLTKVAEINDRATMMAEYNTNYVVPSAGTVMLVDMVDNNAEMIVDGNFVGAEWNLAATDDNRGSADWTLAPVNGVRDTATDVKTAIIDTEVEQNEAWWKETYGIDANPKAPYNFNPVLMINNVNPSAYSLRNVEPLTIQSNMHYRLAMWVKTADIKKDKGISVALMNADGDSSMVSFTNLNTADYENEMPDVNGYVQLEFYLKGSNNVTENNAAADNKQVYILVTFGTGNNFDTDEFLSGKVFIANVNMQQIDASEYDSNTTSSTYKKNYSFASTSGSTSGSLADSKFDVVKYEESTVNAATGTQKDLYKPTSWTVATVDNVKAGVLNTTQEAFLAELRTLTQYDFITDWDYAPVYNAWADSVSEAVKNDYRLDFGAPNVFMAYTEKDKTAKAAKLLNNTSTITLSNNSYYVVRCYVRAIGTYGQLEFSTSGNKETIVVPFGMKDENGDYVNKALTTAEEVFACGWEEICFAVKTGSFGSVKATINLYLGNYTADKLIENADDKPTYQGIIFADSFTCYSVDEKVYNAFVTDAVHTVNYTTETFDTTSDKDELTSPDNSSWSGSGSSETKETGIYNRNYTNTELKYLVEQTVQDEEGNDKVENVADDTKTLGKNNVFNTDGLGEGVELGNGVLVINNQVPAYYTFKSASITLSANTAYLLTLDARTYNIKEGENAIIRIAAGEEKYDILINSEHTYAVEGGKYVYTADGAHTYAETASAWHRYCFYLLNDKSSSVSATLNLMVGQSALEAGTDDSHPVQGTAMFDNVTFEPVADKDVFYAQYKNMYVLDADNTVTTDENGNFVAAAAADEYQLYNKAVRLADDYTNEDDKQDEQKEDEEIEPETDSSLIWLYITSIVIAGILIIVLVVWLIRRYMPKKLFKRTKKVDYSRDAADDSTTIKKSSGADAKTDGADSTDEFND